MIKKLLSFKNKDLNDPTEFKKFIATYKKYLIELCDSNGWTLVRFMPGYYYFFCFIKNNENKFIYLSVSDVRYYRGAWLNTILYRTAKNEFDYTGGFNNYTDLNSINKDIAKLFNR